jgi:hypothetical protein
VRDNEPFFTWESIGPRPRQWPGRLIPALSHALFGGTGKRSRCLLGGGKSLNPLVLSKALFPLPQAPTTFVISRKRRLPKAPPSAHFRSKSDRKVIARRSLQLFGRSFLELFWSARLNPNNLERFLYFEDDSVVKERCSSNSAPAPIFLTIHFSNFEWASVLPLLCELFGKVSEGIGTGRDAVMLSLSLALPYLLLACGNHASTGRYLQCL